MHDAARVRAVAQAERVTELAHRFLHRARPERGLVGADVETEERDDRRTSGRIGDAEGEVEAFRVDVARGHAEHPPAVQLARRGQQPLGAVLAASAVVRAAGQRDRIDERRVDFLAPQIDHELHDLASRRTVHRDHDQRLGRGERQASVGHLGHGVDARARAREPC